MLVLQAFGQIEEHVNHTPLQGGPRYFASLENNELWKGNSSYFSTLLPFLKLVTAFFDWEGKIFFRACDVCEKSITTPFIDSLWGVDL